MKNFLIFFSFHFWKKKSLIIQKYFDGILKKKIPFLTNNYNRYHNIVTINSYVGGIALKSVWWLTFVVNANITGAFSLDFCPR